MDRRQTWLEATEAHGDPLILEAVIGDAGRVHFVGDLPDGFRFLRGAFVDLGFEHYPAPADIREIARAIVGTGVLVPGTHYRLRSHHGGHTCFEAADGGETAALPWDWKRFVVVIGNDDRWSWVGKRVTPERTGGVDLSNDQDDGDGWALKVSEHPPHEVQLFGGYRRAITDLIRRVTGLDRQLRVYFVEPRREEFGR